MHCACVVVKKKKHAGNSVVKYHSMLPLFLLVNYFRAQKV